MTTNTKPSSPSVDNCRRANGLAYTAMLNTIAAVDADFRMGIRPSPNFDRYERASARVWDTACVVALEAEIGQVIATPDGLLIKAEHIGHEHDIEVLLTDDGRVARLDMWHAGASDTDTQVQYERLFFDPIDGMLVRRTHGFIDRHSRRLTQAG